MRITTHNRYVYNGASCNWLLHVAEESLFDETHSFVFEILNFAACIMVRYGNSDFANTV